MEHPIIKQLQDNINNTVINIFPKTETAAIVDFIESLPSLDKDDIHLLWTKNGLTNKIIVPYAAKTRFLEEATGLTRGDNDESIEIPSSLPAGIRVRFKNNVGASGFGSPWYTIVDLTGYSGMSNSGAGYRNLFLFDNGSNQSDGSFWVRNGIDSTWNAWRRVLTDTNYSSVLDDYYYTKSESDANFLKIIPFETGSDVNDITSPGLYYTVLHQSFPENSPFSTIFAMLTSANLSATIRRPRLAFDYCGNIKVFDDNAKDGNDGTWYDVLTSNNYSSLIDLRYVKKTGDTMTGILKLSMNGIVTSLGSTNNSFMHYNTTAPSGHYFNTTVRVNGDIYAGSEYNKKVWHEGNDGSNSGLDADLLDGEHNGSLTANRLNFYKECKSSTDDTSLLSILQLNYTDIPVKLPCAISLSRGLIAMAFGWRLGAPYNSIDTAYCGWFISDYGTPRWIGADNGVWKSEAFAFLSSNVASATKLLTARSLWGQSFDGRSSVSGDLSNVGSITTSGSSYGNFALHPGTKSDEAMRLDILNSSGLYQDTGLKLNIDGSVELRNQYSVRFTPKGDNYGRPTIILIADITKWLSGSSGSQLFGFQGSIIGTRTSGFMREHLALVTCRVGYVYSNTSYPSDIIQLRTSIPNWISPRVIEYGGKTYLGLWVSGPSLTLVLQGFCINCLSQFIQIAFDENNSLPSDVVDVTNRYSVTNYSEGIILLSNSAKSLRTDTYDGIYGDISLDYGLLDIQCTGGINIITKQDGVPSLRVFSSGNVDITSLDGRCLSTKTTQIPNVVNIGTFHDATFNIPDVVPGILEISSEQLQFVGGNIVKLVYNKGGFTTVRTFYLVNKTVDYNYFSSITESSLIPIYINGKRGNASNITLQNGCKITVVAQSSTLGIILIEGTQI